MVSRSSPVISQQAKKVFPEMPLTEQRCSFKTITDSDSNDKQSKTLKVDLAQGVKQQQTISLIASQK